ncbi:hypothetical protein DFP72DRAFT_861485 [Ephemerocybe angulata]|uniref:Uncharacterized protein n=1 Tax=Ephemerocybe angulata TaxID=980116 RepID=A0A8H6LV02_9AGAR|nr:hypothetical protein DFP72DRAFT_861485 [Tulosesus angulatus]
MKVSLQSFAIWDTSPMRSYSVIITDALEKAVALRVYALCCSLPPFELSTYLPYDFKLEVLAVVDWLVPTYHTVRHTLPLEEVEFWIMFAELMDVWSHVPFLRLRPDNFTRLARRLRVGSELIPLSCIPNDRVNIGWRKEMDLNLHTERMVCFSVLLLYNVETTSKSISPTSLGELGGATWTDTKLLPITFFAVAIHMLHSPIPAPHLTPLAIAL